MKTQLAVLLISLLALCSLRAESIADQLLQIALTGDDAALIVSAEGEVIGRVGLSIVCSGVFCDTIIIGDEVVMLADQGGSLSLEKASCVIEDYLPCSARLLSNKDYDSIDSDPEG